MGSVEEPMGVVTFIPFPGLGHVHPTLRLAKELQRRGHRILYLAIRDTADAIEAEGFECVPVFEDVFPKGVYNAYNAKRGQLKGLALLREWREASAKVKSLLARLRGGELNALLKQRAPDLVVFDSLLPQWGIWAWGQGFRIAQFDTNVPWRKEASTPPVFSLVVPGRGRSWRLRSEVEYLAARVQRQVMMTVGAEESLFKSVRTFAETFGYPLELIDFTGILPSINAPEFVMCPREFVEMGSHFGRGDYHFLEPGIDLSRKEPAFPWERLDDRPLIYCSLGSSPFLFNEFRAFFKKLVDVAERRPGWQLVLAVGKEANPAEFDRPNVVGVEFAPQLKLLARASAAVVHGGFNTAKECIYYGVPMFVFPLKDDQPGNSARVLYHGLGVRGDKRATTPEELEAGLAELIEGAGRDGYRQRLARMSTIFRAAEEESPSLRAIEALMAEPQRGAVSGLGHRSDPLSAKSARLSPHRSR
jgi:zeaxanthin glucosyltransferase